MADAATAANWAPVMGEFEQQEDALVFRGGILDYEGQPAPAIGVFISDKEFAGGSISAAVEFGEIGKGTSSEIILFHDPATNSYIVAGLGAAGLYAVRHFQNRWNVLASAGDRNNLRSGRRYQLRVSVLGSRVTLIVDGVRVLSTLLPYQIQQSQVGVWCCGPSDIRIEGFTVSSETPQAFVVMQFTPPYNELYDDVITRICHEHGIAPVRADEVYGPGIIVADVARQIVESKLIIAEISPANPNVYYEIGYAHALGKPTILVAEKGTELPFDVSPFRVLFYENTISGKKRVEEGLRKHLGAILNGNAP